MNTPILKPLHGEFSPNRTIFEKATTAGKTMTQNDEKWNIHIRGLKKKNPLSALDSK